MNNLPSLYDHQIQMRDGCRAALAKHGAAILAAEPGVGKTRMSKWILGSATNRKPTEKQTGRVLFAVYGRNLVDNASDSFNEDPPLPHGRLMSGGETDWKHRLQVGSIDTLLSWYCEGDTYIGKATFDLIVFDECHAHHSKLARFVTLHNQKREADGLNPAFILGLSATPEAKGLADIYKQIVFGPTTKWLIENGFLSGFRYYQAHQGDLSKLQKRGNDFTKDSVCDAMKGLSGDLVRDWWKHGEGRPTVGFFPRLSHAKEAQEQLMEAGIIAEYVDGSTPDDERRAMFAHLGTGRINYICNVGIVERGTNIPAIACVQLCTAIGNVKRYRQMIGRGSRVHPGKTDTIIIDHGGNIARHGFFEDQIEWTLANDKASETDHIPKPTIKCPQCGRVYRGGRCASCDYEPTQEERGKAGLVFDGTELKEIKPTEKAEPKQKTNEQILIGALYACGYRNGTWRQALAICYREAEKLGKRFKVPKSFEVGGREYHAVPYGSADASRRVKLIYPFLERTR